MNKYTGRIMIVSLAVFILFIWNIYDYYFVSHSIHWMLRSILYIIILAVVWKFGAYFDRSKLLIKQLSESQRRYKNLLDETKMVLDNIQEVVFQTDGEGNFIYLNPAWTAVTGYKRAESLYSSFYHYLPFEEKSKVKTTLMDYTYSKSQEGRLETTYRKKSGGEFFADVHFKMYYDQDGYLIGTVGTIHDITERKLAEQEWRELNEHLALKSQKLSIAGQLAAGIAHEVRNPLTSINGFLQLIKNEFPEKDTYFNIIFEEIKRIELVLSEMLVLSKPQAIHFKEKNVITILDQVAALIESNATLNNIQLVKELPEDEILVDCDENQLKQVFINLIKNAIEAMPNGGNITLSCCVKGSSVIVSITDEGIGIPKEKISKLGEPFFSTKDKGTGLGLTVCLRIIKDHYGHINVTSHTDEGTTFEVVLPVMNHRSLLEPV
ncbi:ATP-binding protein [Bacillus sp. UMB0893]|uniref:ATP-binding protein n=1 Tax=Bacillus sp. UMB0893 TaxID=2066053 RepID=UPI000C76162F|nr:ATP-binding protein [Bacillus sp. UMB0893]PLR69551.1 PAS domain-containing sensor histidine kinase [Bacillus sp. UMB0893]